MRNLAIVGLKLMGVLGIYWGITLMAQITFVIISAFSVANLHNTAARTSVAFWSMSPIICTTIMTFIFALTLLTRTDWIVEKFRFPEDPPASGMEPSQLLRVGFVLIGAYVVLGAIGDLGSTAYSIVLYRSGAVRAPGIDYGRIISPALRFILACIVIGRSDRFAKSVFPPAAPAA